MSFLRNIADNIADKIKRAAGVVPPYEVVETTAQQFARCVAFGYRLCWSAYYEQFAVYLWMLIPGKRHFQVR